MGKRGTLVVLNFFHFFNVFEKTPQILENVKIKDTRILMKPSVRKSIKKNLQFQMANKVRWTESVKKLEEIDEKNI